MTPVDDLLLSALRWDPEIRGALIVLGGLVMLPGSVFLLLATNTGAKVGFLLALTGLAGWMAVMGLVWAVFGIGLKGAEPEWKIKEVITGPASQSLVGVMEDFPGGKWVELHPGDAELAEAQASADKVLAPASAGESGGHGEEEGGGEAEAEEHFESPFKRTEDYVLLDGYRHGGEDYFLTLRHRPHYAVVRVKPALFDTPPPGFKPQPDLAAPVTTVVMLRDLGNLRLPPVMVTLSSLIIFLVCCYHLHVRDKEIMRLRAAGTPA